ncbi:MAG: glycosyltransferase family 4 protein [Ardenticatenaceae bacterium]|nr:glycosyltransferase family 4 protein [Ardenticatenaceae bacterium]
MRLVLFVTPGFPRPSLTFTVSKFMGLLEKGWDVQVVTPQSSAADWGHYPDLQRPEITSRVHVLPAPSAGGAKMVQQIAALQPDLLHFEFQWPATRWISLMKQLGCKVTVGLQASEFDYTKPANFYSVLWENADALHVLGQDIWRRVGRLGCPATMPHRIIPAAIDGDFWQANGRTHEFVVGTAERPLRLISVARLEWKKGYEDAFQVVRLLLDQGIHCEYDIIGEGKYADALHVARQQLGLTEVVQFWGSHSRYQVRDALRHADIFLHTAVAEGFCYAALEAQAMQLPVVCSDADGLPENVAPEQTGFVLPRRDIQAMAAKVKLLAATPALRQQMGQAGSIRVQTQFQAERQIDAFADFYQWVMADCPK